MKKIIEYIVNPRKTLIVLMNKNLFGLIPDKQYLKLKYLVKTNKKLNLNTPITYNEKIQWLKLNDRKDIYTIMVDKYEAKKYVGNIIGNQYIIPTIGIYEDFNDIDFEKLPNKFVIKCTHDSGGIVICKNKKNFNKDLVRKKINYYLKRKYYKIHREWPYKNVKPRIIIEKYMSNSNGKPLIDYKFFCFNGEPKLIYISEGLENHTTASMSFYDMDFKLTDCKRKDYPQLKHSVERPKNFDLMKKYAKILSKNIPHLRVDFYEIDGHLYFGELTFSTCAGFIPFEDEKWNIKLGEWIKLPTNND